MAMIEWDPKVKVEVVNVAVVPDRVPVPIVAPPSLNVTVPVGVPPLAVMVAVNVTLCPTVLGLREEVRAMVVVAWSTVCASAVDVDPAKFVSPP